MVSRAYAHVVFEWLSGICCNHPSIARHVVGNNPVQWYVARTPAEDVTWNWLENDPYHGNDVRPVSFGRAAVLGTNVVALRRQRAELGVPGHDPAVAILIGNAVVAGLVQNSVQIVRGDLRVGLRVGAYDLHATMGLLDIANRQFVQSAAGTRTLAERVDVQEFVGRFPGVPLQ